MPAYEEELFGPVAAILRVRDADEALRVANDTTFGLGGSVWSGDPVRGEAIATEFQQIVENYIQKRCAVRPSPSGWSVARPL